MTETHEPPRPYALLAELTHSCPLHCVYCSNPLALVDRDDELTTEQWQSVVADAASIGIVQAHLSGGEPLRRTDLEEIVAAARGVGIFTQLVTSGVGLTADRLAALTEAGLDAVQLSVQAADPKGSDVIAGRRSFSDKREAARLVVAAGVALTINVVLHRRNLDGLDAMVDLAVEWGADRLELANVQFYGWAAENRERLLPSEAQTRQAFERFAHRRSELKDRLAMVWVRQDHHETRPKPCMNGWGSTSLTVAPNGDVLPCPAATSIAGLAFDNVRRQTLSWIWAESDAFNAFRGEGWMLEPCASCPYRHQDHGGCRCQAFALTGSAARTDPVCRWSPEHHLIVEAVTRANSSQSSPGMRSAGLPGDALRYRR
jgi:pyrroloquinoline quinone biosynthesis protein E